jgi:DNA-directed RNA polymerase specialized sigma24 family protein
MKTCGSDSAGDHVQDYMAFCISRTGDLLGIALPFSSSVELDDLMQEAYLD